MATERCMDSMEITRFFCPLCSRMPSRPSRDPPRILTCCPIFRKACRAHGIFCNKSIRKLSICAEGTGVIAPPKVTNRITPECTTLAFVRWQTSPHVQIHSLRKEEYRWPFGDRSSDGFLRAGGGKFPRLCSGEERSLFVRRDSASEWRTIVLLQESAAAIGLKQLSSD